MSYEVAVVGTGADPDDPGGDGYAVAYHRASAYEKVDDVDLPLDIEDNPLESKVESGALTPTGLE
jgi:hypothetical protein